jgi:hypothetical protein
MKKRKSISQPAPFMNKTLRSAVYKKQMTHNKFLKDKSNKNWEAYRKQRNLVTKLKKHFFIGACSSIVLTITSSNLL